MLQDGASRSEPDDDWRLDLDRPEQVMEVLRRASLELVKADSRVEAAEARARELEQELAQARAQGAGLLRNATERCAEIESAIDGERDLLAQQLQELKAAHEEAQHSAAADYQAIEQRAIQAEILGRMYQEKNARLEQRLQQAEETIDGLAARAKRAEGRLERARAALDFEDVPLTEEIAEPIATEPASSRPVAAPALDAVAMTASQGLSRASQWFKAGLQMTPSLRLSQAVVGCAAFLALAGVGGAAFLAPSPPEAHPQAIRVASSDATVGLPLARVPAEPQRVELPGIEVELPPPAEPVRLEAFLSEPPPPVAPPVAVETFIVPAAEDLPRLDFAQADLLPAEPSVVAPERPARKPAKAAKAADAPARLLTRPASNKLPQPAN